mmetsp:Transcript_45218/g.130994  ORF Transcript_45218/g.130994 Transcript_45218/m.130994 type:complete len:139 (-) Transcript_45218:89-505(-)
MLCSAFGLAALEADSELPLLGEASLTVVRGLSERSPPGVALRFAAAGRQEVRPDAGGAPCEAIPACGTLDARCLPSWVPDALALERSHEPNAGSPSQARELEAFGGSSVPGARGRADFWLSRASAFSRTRERRTARSS